MAFPLVSVCIPTRNRCDSLRESVESVCAQDYPALDILISDNCSDDATEQVSRDLLRRDSRVRYVRHAINIGLHGNHNFCIDSARGEFLCIFHDHDRRALTIVSEYVAFLQEHPTVGVVCSDWDLIDDADRRLGVREHRGGTIVPGKTYITRTIRSGRSAIGIPGAMARTAALGDARFCPDAPIGFGDFPLWFRVAETWDVGHIPKILWSWRQNRESHSARPIMSIADDFARNIGGYCDSYIVRWPDQTTAVAAWRRALKRYLFWALAYEVALHFRRRGEGAKPSASRSLFEIMDYRLGPDDLARTLDQMKGYRVGLFEHATLAAIELMIWFRLSAGLGWLARHHVTLRSWLGLK